MNNSLISLGNHIYVCYFIMIYLTEYIIYVIKMKLNICLNNVIDLYLYFNVKQLVE